MLPVVWLFGTPGVGKSTVGWQVCANLAAAEVMAAFVDADQLRLAAGVAASETELIASGLRALEPGYRDAGARLMIVAGIADGPAHLARLLADVPRSDILACLAGDHRRGLSGRSLEESIAASLAQTSQRQPRTAGAHRVSADAAQAATTATSIITTARLI